MQWTFKFLKTVAAGALLVLVASIAHATCWEQAARRYGVSAHLLYAVARTESNLDPMATNRSHLKRTKSYDIGLMQINSSHLPRLTRYGITEKNLFEPCTNLHVGAWLLADNFARHGLTWNAVGAYNAACTQLKGEACTTARATYAWKVYRHLSSLDTTPTTVRAHSRPSMLAKAQPTLHVRVAP